MIDAAICVGGILVAGVVFQQLVPVRVTPDSLQYLSSAGLFLRDGGLELIEEQNLLYRLATTGLLHALAVVDDQVYGQTVMPVIGISGLLLLSVLVWEEARRALVGVRASIALALLAGIYALTTFQGLYAVFYINSHGVVMTAFLIMVVGGYRASRGETAWLLPLAMVGPLIVVARTEGALLVALALLPLLTTLGPLSTRQRALAAAPSAVIAVVWFGGVIAPRVPPSLSATDPVLGPIVITLGLVAAGSCWRWSAARGALRHLPVVAVAGMLALSVVGSIRAPEILTNSLYATVSNVLATGNWALTWPVLMLLVICVSVTKPRPDPLLHVPVLGYFVLVAFLPFARGYPYRVGPGDSGNRVLVHVLLVGVFMLIAGGLMTVRHADATERRTVDPVP